MPCPSTSTPETRAQRWPGESAVEPGARQLEGVKEVYIVGAAKILGCQRGAGELVAGPSVTCVGAA